MRSISRCHHSRRSPARRPTCAVLFVGRLAERKGVRYLIDAVAALPRELQPRLTIIGDGPERQALEAQTHALHAEDRVAFLGWVTPEQLDAAYAAASVFVLPAVVDARGDTEGLGMVLLEAMTYTVPVISTPLGGVTDIVQDDRDRTARAAERRAGTRSRDRAARHGSRDRPAAGHGRTRLRFEPLQLARGAGTVACAVRRSPWGQALRTQIDPLRVIRRSSVTDPVRRSALSAWRPSARTAGCL